MAANCGKIREGVQQVARKKKTDKVEEEVRKSDEALADDVTDAQDAIETAQETPGDADQDDSAGSESEADAQASDEEGDGSVEGDSLDDMLDEADPEAGDFAPDPVIEDAPERRAESTPEPTPTPAPTVTENVTVVRKGGFFPLLLGGVAAAAIGFGAARYVLPEGWPFPGQASEFEATAQAAMEANASAIDAVKAEVAALARGPDLSGIEARIAEAQDALTTRIEEVATKVEGYETRLTTLEARPITDAAGPEAVAAYERELKALQDAMAAQRAEIEAIAADAEAKRASAEMSVQEAMKRGALSRIQTAMETGSGFADAVESLKAAGVDVPAALANSAEGVASQDALLDAFPGVALKALTVARKSEGGGFGNFLKNQLGVRSLEPKEGDDADAVLSRAEAAVREGRLGDALTELQALPENVRAELSDWMGAVTSRQSALDAVDALAAQVNSN